MNYRFLIYISYTYAFPIGEPLEKEIKKRGYEVKWFADEPETQRKFSKDKAVIKDIVEECKKLKDLGVNSVAICANDAENYPEDSFDNMIIFAKKNHFDFPYLVDETQEIARIYDAVCTPDFFGYNKDLELQYRGRLRELKNLAPVRDGESDLFKAMKQIVEIGKGPENQTPSAGCSIKWKNN